MIKLICGILICSYSLMFWIIHLNMLVLNKELVDYIIYALTHYETLLLFLGIYFIFSALHQKS